MKFNISKLIKIANSVVNPKQGAQMLLQEMAKKSPDKANAISAMMSNGKNPTEAIQEFASKGDVTIDQLNQLKSMYGMARKFGLKHNVPESVWKDAEKAIKNKSNNFNGF